MYHTIKLNMNNFDMIRKLNNLAKGICFVLDSVSKLVSTIEDAEIKLFGVICTYTHLGSKKKW